MIETKEFINDYNTIKYIRISKDLVIYFEDITIILKNGSYYYNDDDVVGCIINSLWSSHLSDMLHKYIENGSYKPLFIKDEKE